MLATSPRCKRRRKNTPWWKGSGICKRARGPRKAVRFGGVQAGRTRVFWSSVGFPSPLLAVVLKMGLMQIVAPCVTLMAPCTERREKAILCCILKEIYVQDAENVDEVEDVAAAAQAANGEWDDNADVQGSGEAGYSEGSSSIFELYYRAQDLLESEDEWNEFMESLRRPLPVTFRVNRGLHSPGPTLTRISQEERGRKRV